MSWTSAGPWRIAGCVVAWLVLDLLLIRTGGEGFRLVLSRAMLLAVTAALLARNAAALSALWYQRGSGFDLAVFRLVFFGLFVLGFLVVGTGHLEKTLLSMIHLPPEARVSPPLLGWIAPVLPVGERLSRTAIVLLLGSASLAFVGLWTRGAIAVFTLAALYVFGVPQLFGKINHNHHLVWFPAVLAFSGCGDVLSIDCWRRNGSRAACLRSSHDTRYGRALAGLWILLGVLYFFPGFQKIWVSGLDWIYSDPLSRFAHQHAMEVPGWRPLVSLDGLPVVVGRALAGAAVCFEIGYVFLVPHARWRAGAAVAAVLFHLGTWLMLDIFFVDLLLFQAVLVSWERVFGIEARAGGVDARGHRALDTVIAVLVAGNVVCGVLSIHSWPFSAYPAFSVVPAGSTEVLEFDEVLPDGSVREIPAGRLLARHPSERYRSLEVEAIRLHRQGRTSELTRLLRGVTQGLAPQHRIRARLVEVRWVAGEPVRARRSGPLAEWTDD